MFNFIMKLVIEYVISFLLIFSITGLSIICIEFQQELYKNPFSQIFLISNFLIHVIYILLWLWLYFEIQCIFKICKQLEIYGYSELRHNAVLAKIRREIVMLP